MRMSRSFLLATSASLAVLFGAVSIAAAQTRQKRAQPAREIIVKKRSFLDSGRMVPVGSESNYVQAGTYFNRSPQYFGNRSGYGAETLPGRFDIPGARPLFTF